MRITALAGGIGGARFLRGLQRHLTRLGGEHQITVIGNTADDLTLHGLRVCPDLDTLMYTLGGGIHEEQGWGRAGETFGVSAELAAYGAQPQWFTLGDRDIATHLVRTRLLAAGQPLSAVTAALCERWQPGVTLLPMSDDRVESHVVIEDPDAPGGERAIHFQEWWVRLRAQVPARRILAIGIDTATPGPGVLRALTECDAVLLPPSNPVVSIGTILSVPGVRAALRESSAPVVGVSPVIAGAPVRGMADACLQAIGVPSTAAAVAGLYADFLTGWLVAPQDEHETPPPGVRQRAVPLLMSDEQTTADLAAAALDLAEQLRPARAEGVSEPLLVLPLTGIGPVHAGDDLAALLAQALRRLSTQHQLQVRADDVLVASSKVVSKALGLSRPAAEREAMIDAATVRLVAHRDTPRGRARIVQTVAGPVMAAAGVDTSNVAADTALALPADPDAAARQLRAELAGQLGVTPAVVLSDTAGRAWRTGQTDFALGVAGLQALEDLRGQPDSTGRTLDVTQRAVADELAAAADLVKGKASDIPAVLVRGAGSWCTPQDGAGASVLLRSGGEDWFRLGHVEAVRAALGVAEQQVPPPTAPPGDAEVRLRRVLAAVDSLHPNPPGGPWHWQWPDPGPRPQPHPLPHPLQVQLRTDAAATPALWLALGALTEQLRALAWTEDLPVLVTPAQPPFVLRVSVR